MRRLAGLLLALVILTLAACSSDDSGGDAVDVTPVGTKDATPTPGAANGGGNGDAPAPVEPEVDEELTEIARSELVAEIPAGDSYAIDPVRLASDAGAKDGCSNLQFDFSWQVSDPYPPGDAVVAWVFAGDSGEFDVASAAAGNQSVGCGQLRAENRGAEAITVAIKYAIAVLP